MPPQTSHTPHRTWASGDDNTGFYLVILLICTAASSYLLWDSHHGEISKLVLRVFHQEIAAIRGFTGDLDGWDRQIRAANPEWVTLRDLYHVSRDVGMALRVPAAALILLLAIACVVRAAPSRYRRAFDADGLIREQALSHPTTAAFAGRRLHLTSPAEGQPRPADYALTTEEWITRCGCDADRVYVPAIARHALVAQLGSRWRGLDHADPVVRLMAAVFALHLAKCRAEALDMLGQISVALSIDRDDAPEGPGTPLVVPPTFIAYADDILRHPEIAGPALAVMDCHAFEHTALMTLLIASREAAGVLAPGQFAWLKLVDRPLWYALHSLGFETEGQDRYIHPAPRVEAAGARDHWAVERAAQSFVAAPSVDRALDAVSKVAASMPKPDPQPTPDFTPAIVVEAGQSTWFGRLLHRHSHARPA